MILCKYEQDHRIEIFAQINLRIFITEAVSILCKKKDKKETLLC